MRWRGAFAGLVLLLVAKEAGAATCMRPTDPGGVAGYSYAEAPATFDTEHVRVWYARSGKDAVRASSSREDGVPDDVVEVGAVTEDALARFGAMGFRKPISDDDPACGSNGGDARLDVYLVHFTAADGVTVPERCIEVGGARQCASFIIAEARLGDRYESASEGIRTVLPHELFHAVQNAYDAEVDRYWAEGTAQWAAKTLDPTLADFERNLPAFFSAAGRSLDVAPAGVTSGYLYGAAIWPLFLSLRHDASVIRDIFEEEGARGGSALAAARGALERRGDTLDETWSTFWSWNASTAERADGAGYPDAERYPLVATRELEGTASGVTSGTMAIAYHLVLGSRSSLALESSGVHRARLVPVEGGKAIVARSVPLPVVYEGEAIVLLTSVSESKADAPFEIVVSAPAASPSVDGETGCSATGRAADGSVGAVVASAALAWLRRRARGGPRRRRIGSRLERRGADSATRS